jgi:hypothetical protein
MDLHVTMGAVGAAIATYAGLARNVFGVTDWIVARSKGVWRFFSHRGSDRVPSKTVILLPEPRINALYWTYAGTPEAPAMQVVGDLVVTNISQVGVNLPIGVLRYRRRRWYLARKEVRASPWVKDLKSPYSGGYGIPPGGTTHVRAAFVWKEQERPPIGDLVADVALVDQFGNHHWLRRLRLKHPSKMHE